MIDWANPESRITEHFTVREALLLPSWGILHTPTDIECFNILRTCQAMEFVRAALGGRSITVHCMIRPSRVNCPGSPRHGKDYNAAIGSKAKRSPHILGLACDFHAVGLDCDEARAILLPRLDELEICMEDMPRGNWVHVDLYNPSAHGGRRFFKP
jgi:hypothetical protein